MPSEHTTTITMPPEVCAHVERLAERARAAGQPFPTYTTRRKVGRKVEAVQEVRLSPVIHRALAFAAEHMPLGDAPAEPAPTPDAARLRAAMARAGVSGPDVARAIGCHRATVAHALKGTLALEKAAGGALLAWVERVEAGD